MEAKISPALSFDDVLLVPQHSEILPGEADLNSHLSPGFPLHIPILSSAMDTVTEDQLAIALAREGGVGVIHRNCPIDEQAKFVASVKYSEHAVIRKPITVGPDDTLEELEETMARKRFSGFPVVDEAGVLVGIVSRRDTWFVEDGTIPVREVMTGRDKLVTAAPGLHLDEARAILYRNRIEKLPLVDGEGKLCGLITSKDIEKSVMFEDACKDPNGQLRVGGAVGVSEDYLARAGALIDAGCDGLFVDAATGHTSRVIKVVETLASRFEIPVVAGNVVTPEGARDLHKAGASAIKVGVGPGSICTTRVISGVGVPQFTAVQRVAEYCRPNGVTLIADGGLRYSGDLVKALAGGADLVMLGSLLAGTEESPGNTVRWQGRTFKEYRGMGSLKAMRKGSGDRYGQNASGKLVPEGVEARVPFKGSLRDTIFQLVGGIRSGMGYVGAHTLEELREKARFVQITSGGLRESHPHDIVITEEPVNYSTS